MFYDQLKLLCANKATTPTRLALEFGMSKGNVTRWKNGGTPSIQILKKMADYFNVSTDFLLTGKEPDPEHPENEVTFDDFSYALLDESKPLTEENKRTLLDMAKMLRKRQRELGTDKSKDK